MKKFTRQEWAILVLTFILILISSSLFRLVDETLLEWLMPWHLGFFSLVGFGLSMVVNFPFITIIKLINGDGEIISYDSYFSLLPFITAFFYSALVAILIGKEKRRK